MRVFWDTNLFIYLWENGARSHEANEAANFLEAGGHTLATSTLTLGEILVHPLRNQREDLAGAYSHALQRLALIPFDHEAALCFAKLRAQNPNVRPPDAIQLACAVIGRCDLFLTHDDRLIGFPLNSTMRIQSLAAWMADQNNI